MAGRADSRLEYTGVEFRADSSTKGQGFHRVLIPLG